MPAYTYIHTLNDLKNGLLSTAVIIMQRLKDNSEFYLKYPVISRLL